MSRWHALEDGLTRLTPQQGDTSANVEPSTDKVRRGRGLTSQEAAQFLGVKVSTLAKWRLLGVGPPYSDSLGRDPRYHQDDLDTFLWGQGVVHNSGEAKQRRRRRRVSGAEASQA